MEGLALQLAVAIRMIKAETWECVSRRITSILKDMGSESLVY